MDSLKPCPFCGGEAKRSSETFERTILSWVYCTNCGAAGGYRHTEAEAIEAWNARAERTCANVDEYANCGFFVCGNCGFGENDIELTPNYCPNCGARITPKNSETTLKVVGE